LRLRAAAAIAALVLLCGCDKIMGARSPFQSIDVTGAAIGDELRLTDQDGKARSLADFRGKVVVVNFGYTQCPDVCPTTLSDLAGARRKLGPEAAAVQVLFVTLDPERDTQELLRQYVPAFDPTFVALRGDAAQTEQVLKDFKVYAQKREGKSPGSYTVEHNTQSFVFDRQGKLRLMFAYPMVPEAVVSDLRILLNS
jgi:protein SCO1/2